MKSPPNETGAVLRTPIPKLLLAQQYHLPRAAQPCPHISTVIERMPPGHVHFARVTCRSCRAFIKWLPRPQTVQRQRLNGYRLARLSMAAGLSEWERHFVRDVSHRKRVSPAQQTVIDRLVAEYLERA
jgi:hypothetical protein